ncbi:HAMP domain-containing sensor histidine kinase [Pelosinus sp. IPA-1]|uniref:ATP-binding protein n=1 Tax=Pelosinus sp. IPA-1 TaxID=3029569 RepID=UPI002436168F|nr:HAMP domain-containing sensor histidine kinase [Pelosinus sp. IPA-1]GMB00980.1 two-component sensor histidine kinase [Pelosinus sp. IPA-1]
MNSSLQLKLLAGFMLVITATLGIVLGGISMFIKDQILAGKQQDLLRKGTELAHVVQNFQDESGSLEQLGDFLTNADQYLDARIWVLDKSHQIVAMSGRHMPGNRPHESGFGPGNHGPMGGGMGLQPMGGMRALINELDPVYSGQVVTKTMEQPYYGEKMVVVAVPIKNQADGSVIGAVLLNAPVTGINEFMQRVYYYVGVGGIVALLLALLVANRLTRAIVRPLKSMEKTAESLAKGDYTTRVTVTSSDEVGRLGHALNALAQDLANYMTEVEKAEKLRRDFVANVSHELRTPLTVIQGYTEALLDGTASDSTQTTKYLSIMREETIRLERLVKDLLDLSRLQSETVAWHVESIPLPAIAGSVVHILQQSAAQKNITLHLAVEDIISNILGNGDRLTQLLLILLDNALKYTPNNGHITLSITQEQDSVILAVADSGTGISLEDLPYIWDRFYKVDKSHSRSESGAGLGLAIAKQIIERHQAKAEISSQIGQGTTFTIRFPLQENL